MVWRTPVSRPWSETAEYIIERRIKPKSAGICAIAGPGVDGCRDGHVNVNDSERLAALKALNHFIDSGEIERGKDGTVVSNLNSSAEFVGDTAINSIISISENHGNIFSGFVAADLQRLGISINSHFQLTLGTQTVRVFWGTNYHDVGLGEWVAFISADDSLMIARNTDNACATVSCKTGDPLILFR